MKLRRLLFGIARGGWLLSYGILGLLWLVRGEWLWAALMGALGGFAVLASYGRWAWPASVNFLALLAVSGLEAALSRWAALGSVLCGLVAWDVELFARRLEAFPDVPHALVRAHLGRLGAIVLLSGVLGVMAASVTVSLSFGWVLLIAFGFLVAFVILLRHGGRE
ncbi:MAG: hypothetical protein ACK4HB_05445 [Candidatus Bipolaricaulia bacterium]